MRAAIEVGVGARREGAASNRKSSALRRPRRGSGPTARATARSRSAATAPRTAPDGAAGTSRTRRRPGCRSSARRRSAARRTGTPRNSRARRTSAAPSDARRASRRSSRRTRAARRTRPGLLTKISATGASVEDRLEAEERRNPVDLLAAARPEHLRADNRASAGCTCTAARRPRPQDARRSAAGDTDSRRRPGCDRTRRRRPGRRARPGNRRSHGVEVVERRRRCSSARRPGARCRGGRRAAAVARPRARARGARGTSGGPARRDSTTCVMSSPRRLAVVEAQLEDELARRLPRRISGDDEARGPRVPQQRKGALDVGAHEPEMDRQPLLPSVAFEQQRDLLDRMRRMRDPPPAEDALPVGHEPVDAELAVPESLCSLMVDIGKGAGSARFGQRRRCRRWHWERARGGSARDVGKGSHSSGGGWRGPRVELGPSNEPGTRIHRRALHPRHRRRDLARALAPLPLRRPARRRPRRARRRLRRGLRQRAPRRARRPGHRRRHRASRRRRTRARATRRSRISTSGRRIARRCRSPTRASTRSSRSRRSSTSPRRRRSSTRSAACCGPTAS